MGETRLNLFRIEYDDEEGEEEHAKGTLRFWYVGCVHDLARPSGGMSSSFYKYAENFMHVVKEEKAEELSQLQSALVTSRHALKAMKTVGMRWKCEE